jgi:hypothetical protein
MDRTVPNLKDALLSVTKALPNGAAAVESDGLDVGAKTDRGIGPPVAILIEAPALATADLPDTETMTYKLQHDDDSAFGTAADLADALLTQTGAGGAGADAASVRYRLPPHCKRYVRAVATNSGAGDASDKDMTVSAVF